VTTENPFEDVERAVAEAIARQLELVRELDAMEVDVTPWEADFLNNVLQQLEKDRRALTQTQLETLRKMCEQYDIEFGDFFDDRK
jgi:hypothetical protein